jgi:hypothetical protein
MSLHSFTTFSKSNQRMIFLLIASHLVWGCALIGFWSTGRLFATASLLWSGLYLALQLFAAAQLLLPALLIHPEERNRGFYLFWAIVLLLTVWLLQQLSPTTTWQPLLNAFQTALLLLVATVTGSAMARYIDKLWEIVPVCLVMTLADFASWLYGPTAGFTQAIQQHYQAPSGPPPLVDMILVKLAFPGASGLLPAFGISDWIMVVFFAIVAARHEVNDNLIGACGEKQAQQGRVGCYLPVSVVALFMAMTLAQTTGLFIPALPVIALVMMLWYSLRYLLLRF